jgi:hypothetical protein
MLRVASTLLIIFGQWWLFSVRLGNTEVVKRLFVMPATGEACAL